MRRPRNWRLLLRASTTRGRRVVYRCFLVRQYVGQAGKDWLRGESQRLGTLLSRMQHMQYLRVTKPLQLTYRASQDFGDGLLSLWLVELLGTPLFEEEDRALLKENRMLFVTRNVTF